MVVSYIIRGLTKFALESGFSDDVQSIKDKNEKEVFDKIRNKILTQVKEFNANNKDYIQNFSKKLSYFMINLRKKLINLKNKKEYIFTSTAYKSVIYNYMIDCIIKMGYDYVRFDSLTVLQNIYQLGILHNCLIPESVMLVYLNEHYYNPNISLKECFNFPIVIWFLLIQSIIVII